MACIAVLLLMTYVASGFVQCFEGGFILSFLDRVFCENVYLGYFGFLDVCALEGRVDFQLEYSPPGGTRSVKMQVPEAGVEEWHLFKRVPIRIRGRARAGLVDVREGREGVPL